MQTPNAARFTQKTCNPCGIRRLWLTVKKIYMLISPENLLFTPNITPMNFSGVMNANVSIKDDSVRADGTCLLFIQLSHNWKRKKLSLYIYTYPNDFDKIKKD
jgi:hypothetical protein